MFAVISNGFHMVVSVVRCSKHDNWLTVGECLHLVGGGVCLSLFVNGYQPALVGKEARGKKMEAPSEVKEAERGRWKPRVR